MHITAEDYLTVEDWQSIEEACKRAGYYRADFDFMMEDLSKEGTLKSGLPEVKVNVGLKVVHKKSGTSKTYPYLKTGQADGAGILAFSEDLQNRLF